MRVQVPPPAPTEEPVVSTRAEAVVAPDGRGGAFRDAVSVTDDVILAAVAGSAAANSVTGTPSIFVGPRTGQPARVGSAGSVPSSAEVAQAIEMASAS